MGKNGVFGYIMFVFGIKNVIEIDDEWLIVGWEMIVKKNFIVIVVGLMECCCYLMDSFEFKMVFFESDFVMWLMEFVEWGYVFLMDV